MQKVIKMEGLDCMRYVRVTFSIILNSYRIRRADNTRGSSANHHSVWLIVIKRHAVKINSVINSVYLFIVKVLFAFVSARYL